MNKRQAEVERRKEAFDVLDRAVALGIADIEAGRVTAADDVFDELRARYLKPILARK